jgi:hypothetical protein
MPTDLSRDDAEGGRGHGHLRLALRNAAQLFNSLDPSPFYERDLDPAAENFLLSWVGELHPHADLRLTLYLKERPAEPEPEHWIAQAIHHHFGERARLERAALLALLRQGRTSLLIGIAFLTACTLLAQAFATLESGTLTLLLREGFLITGWVAMWRPVQIYLYDWWPLRRRARLYRRLAQIPVDLRFQAGSGSPE